MCGVHCGQDDNLFGLRKISAAISAARQRERNRRHAMKSTSIAALALCSGLLGCNSTAKLERAEETRREHVAVTRHQ